MKLEVIIDPVAEEKVVIYSKQQNRLIEEIKQLVESSRANLLGYKDKEAITINLQDVYCFIVDGNKIFAVMQNERLLLKERLYVIEETLPAHFVKINQSCIANLNKIERFDASVSGTLKICFKNGYSDYVSRRQLKTIKQRIGI